MATSFFDRFGEVRYKNIVISFSQVGKDVATCVNASVIAVEIIPDAVTFWSSRRRLQYTFSAFKSIVHDLHCPSHSILHLHLPMLSHEIILLQFLLLLNQPQLTKRIERKYVCRWTRTTWSCHTTQKSLDLRAITFFDQKVWLVGLCVLIFWSGRWISHLSF